MSDHFSEPRDTEQRASRASEFGASGREILIEVKRLLDCVFRKIVGAGDDR